MIGVLQTCILYTCLLAPPTPAFAIYLVVPELTCQQGGEPRRSIELNSVTLGGTPWLTDSDVKEYDPTTTTFTLSRTRSVSFPDVSVFGTAWVIVVDGKRDSAGMFWTTDSSWCCCPLPIIDTTPELATVPVDDTHHLVIVPDVLPAINHFAIENLNDKGTLQTLFKRLGKSKK